MVATTPSSLLEAQGMFAKGSKCLLELMIIKERSNHLSIVLIDVHIVVKDSFSLTTANAAVLV